MCTGDNDDHASRHTSASVEAAAAGGAGRTRHRLVVLSGPSCVGKSPLVKALARLHPEALHDLKPLVLYNSRAPRPGEEDGVDYHFCGRDQIQRLAETDDHVVMDVRGDLQAIDLRDLLDSLATHSVFFEGNPFVGKRLLVEPELDGVDKLGVFMSPLSEDEIRFFQQPDVHMALEDLLTDVMRRKLLRRTRRQKTHLGLPDLENIERRAASAYRELCDAYLFPYVIPNHDGEDSENWDAFYYPLGDARNAMAAFMALLLGQTPPPWVESWSADLLS